MNLLKQVINVMKKECIWHNAQFELPDEEIEVIVMYDNGRLGWNHRTKNSCYVTYPNGKKTVHETITDDYGWCRHSTTANDNIILWTENPLSISTIGKLK